MADSISPAVAGMPRLLLRLEGLALLAGAMFAYAMLDQSWWLFAILILAPDLAIAGYLAGPRVGAAVYNAAHLTLWPIALGTCGYLAAAPLAIAVALIWAAHIGMDRAFGIGLKYPSAFADTHLGRAGRSPLQA